MKNLLKISFMAILIGSVLIVPAYAIGVDETDDISKIIPTTVPPLADDNLDDEC